MKISLLQMKVLSTPLANLDKIDKFLSEAHRRGTDIAVLPEMCCCPYENDAFVKYAMEENDLFIRELSHYAKKYNLILVAGTVPEKTSEGIYNTSFVFDTSGKIIARHRKIHLFDINIENGQYFKESDTFLAGKDIMKFDTKWGKIGLMICYDIRFPELSRLMADDVKLIIVPASFNFSTGPKHWELLFRARAVDNQVYMAGCSAATDYQSSYQSWGHSIITNPWGDVSKQLDNGEEILTENLDFSYVEKVRQELPLLQHRRADLYRLNTIIK
jgi:predicted amidohydrolase